MEIASRLGWDIADDDPGNPAWIQTSLRVVSETLRLQDVGCDVGKDRPWVGPGGSSVGEAFSKRTDPGKLVQGEKMFGRRPVASTLAIRTALRNTLLANTKPVRCIRSIAKRKSIHREDNPESSG